MISQSVCPNCGKMIFHHAEPDYTFCYSCQSSFTVEVIGGTTTLKPASPDLHKSIDRLVNLEYLINNTQSRMKTVQREIRVYQILKIFSILSLLVFVWMIISLKLADNIQLILMAIGLPIFLFLLSVIVVSQDRKKLEQNQREQAEFQNEKASIEEAINALTNHW